MTHCCHPRDLPHSPSVPGAPCRRVRQKTTVKPKEKPPAPRGRPKVQTQPSLADYSQSARNAKRHWKPREVFWLANHPTRPGLPARSGSDRKSGLSSSLTAAGPRWLLTTFPVPGFLFHCHRHCNTSRRKVKRQYAGLENVGPGWGNSFWRAQAVVAPGFMPGGRWRRRRPGCAGDKPRLVRPSRRKSSHAVNRCHAPSGRRRPETLASPRGTA